MEMIVKIMIKFVILSTLTSHKTTDIELITNFGSGARLRTILPKQMYHFLSNLLYEATPLLSRK